MTTTTKTSNGSGPAPPPAAGGVASRLDRARELAANDPAGAQADVWAWFRDAGSRITGPGREQALAELSELFRAGAPSTGIDGPTEGMLVGFTTVGAVDRTLAGITGAWLPWVGKSFDAAAERGENLLLRSARMPSKLLWPLYGMKDAGENVAAFEFTTRVEPGAIDADRDVLVIDYASVDSNPALVIKSIRDELVEVVPGAHLGKMLWISGGGAKHTLLAYFALRSRL